MDASPLQKLPRKARDEMYALALQLPFHITIEHNGYKLSLKFALREKQHLALTLSCKRSLIESLRTSMVPTASVSKQARIGCSIASEEVQLRSSKAGRVEFVKSASLFCDMSRLAAEPSDRIDGHVDKGLGFKVENAKCQTLVVRSNINE